MALNIGLSWLLLDWMGFTGLALSLSLTSTLRMAILLAVLSRRLGGLIRDMGRCLLRLMPAMVALVLAGLVLAGPLARLTDPANGRSPGRYLVFATALGGLGLLYLVVAHLSRVPELAEATSRVRNRLRRHEKLEHFRSGPGT